jgi:hypothetical protein
MVLLAQNAGNDAASIHAQMSAIRRSTNWSDPAAAKTANAKIQELSAKLTQALRQSSPPAQVPGSGDLKPEEAAKIQQENDVYGNKLWNQMMKIVQEGGKGKWDLAEPLREEIVEEYQNDEKLVLNPILTDDMTTLVLDMTMPGVRAIIDEMELFKSITTLIISGGETGVPVDLSFIFNKAKNYPLTELYIFSFRNFVTSLPENIAQFSGLTILDLYGNNINSFPPEISNLTSIKVLYLDENPVKTVFPLITRFKNLEILGLYKTKIPGDEVIRIGQIYPECKITAK